MFEDDSCDDDDSSKHATHKTNRHINRAIHNRQGYNITLTTSQVQEAIKQSKNNNSQGPEKIKYQAPKTYRPSWTRIPHEYV